MTRRRRFLVVTALLLVAPWMAEVSWGGIPAADVALLVVFLSPLYGAAALVIREWARRTGRGWPSMLLMGAAFGLMQCGLIDQSLFNPSYGRYDFQHPLHVPGLHFSLLFFLSFVSGHALISIAVPIALVEGTSPQKEPWLGRVGTGIAVAAYVVASVLNFLDLRQTEDFQATPVQSLSAGLGVAALVLAAHLVRPRAVSPGSVPPVWVMLLLGSAGYQLVQVVLTLTWVGFLAALVLLGATWVVVGRWSVRAAWTRAHTMALAVGAALLNVVVAFPNEPYYPTSARAELVNDVITSAVTLSIVVISVLAARAGWRGVGGHRMATPAPSVPTHSP